MLSALVSRLVEARPRHGIRVELVLGPGEDRVVVVTSEGELRAQFAQLARAGWELRRTIDQGDDETGVARLTMEFENPIL